MDFVIGRDIAVTRMSYRDLPVEKISLVCFGQCLLLTCQLKQKI